MSPDHLVSRPPQNRDPNAPTRPVVYIFARVLKIFAEVLKIFAGVLKIFAGVLNVFRGVLKISARS